MHTALSSRDLCVTYSKVGTVGIAQMLFLWDFTPFCRVSYHLVLG